jgi:hypothetical protein
MKKLFKNIHRWIGLLLVGFVVFYCFTGILLNHRKSFNYFAQKKRDEYKVSTNDIKPLREFIDFYKSQIRREDDPKVIKIRDGRVIEFLYGSHGKTTYVIDPLVGRMEKIERMSLQPWAWLNRLHRAFKTSDIWIFITDIVAILLTLVTLTGALILRYKRLDYILITTGCMIFILAIIVA